MPIILLEKEKKQAFLIFLIGVPILVLYRLFVEWGLNIEIPAKTKIGKGFILHHGQGLVIHPDTIIGHNVTLRHGTTIGTKDMGSLPSRPPVIEDNVNIGAHVVLIGDITIGKDAIIGAGSVVLMDVPANSATLNLMMDSQTLLAAHGPGPSMTKPSKGHKLEVIS